MGYHFRGPAKRRIRDGERKIQGVRSVSVLFVCEVTNILDSDPRPGLWILPDTRTSTGTVDGIERDKRCTYYQYKITCTLPMLFLSKNLNACKPFEHPLSRTGQLREGNMTSDKGLFLPTSANTEWRMGKILEAFSRNARGFQPLDAGLRANTSGSRPPRPWNSVLQHSLFLHDVGP